MTAAVYRSGTPSLAVPQTQNTALVLEFNCLYTHDVRRKQKRWQDGFLRFHTHNKRVMVYDVPRNFIGDTHWKESGVLQDGDEVTLEKDGVIVQVAENVGRTETDLTELRNSVRKGSSAKGSSSPIREARHPPPCPPTRVPAANLEQLKHRSLKSLLGTSRGPIGKAMLPTRSPFEERRANAENRERESNRPSKRQRTNEPEHRNGSRVAPTSKPLQNRDLSALANMANPTSRIKKGPTKQHHAIKEVIDLCSDSDDQDRFMQGFSSDALVPPSPQRPLSLAQPTIPELSSSPFFQRQTTPEAARKRVSNSETVNEGRSTSNGQHGVQFSRSDADAQISKSARVVSKAPTLPPTDHIITMQSDANASRAEWNAVEHDGHRKSGKTLRMATTAPKKKTLLCQGHISTAPTRGTVSTTPYLNRDLQFPSLKEAQPPTGGLRTQRERLEERLSKIRKRDRVEGSTSTKANNNITEPRARNAESGRRYSPAPVNAIEFEHTDEETSNAAREQSKACPRPPTPEQRHLRRIVSESNSLSASKPKRAPGAHVGITKPSSKKSPTPATTSPHKKSESQQASNTAVQHKPRSKRPVQRAVSLNTTANPMSTAIFNRPFQAPKPPNTKTAVPDKAADPWSREAFDLFTWRPPDWDEEKWCVKKGVPESV